MQITQIRIAGFKSFVDPTDVPVEEGLTGIVGPNGCGKSNLLEALRWAMGASSARAMRGSEMDDLIFSGSADRPARETAEVTLILDNSERKAPPEFNASDTLEILRRLKRGVGSTYKLNGRTVRGKDIQLLFADASTGANSPALVRQGQISELIAAKPQNRRRILEEAAGISGLNTRRHEAELKLRAAETNLERLTELNAEVERQHESLKRQARKARKYKTLSTEIAGLEALAAHLRWKEAGVAREQAAAALNVAKTKVAELSKIDTEAEDKRLKAFNELPPLREKESKISAKLGQARIALARLEAENKAAIDALQRLEDELGHINTDIEREQAMVNEASQAKTRAENELTSLPSDGDDTSVSDEDQAREGLETARAQLRTHEASVDQLSTQLAEARARQYAARESLETQTRREASLREEADTLTAELGAISDTKELSQTLEDAIASERAGEQAVHDAKSRLEMLETKTAKLAEQEKKAEVPVLEFDQAVRALEGEIAGLERLVKRTDNSKASPVLDQVRTKDGYERAIAAALGDDLKASTNTSEPLYWAGAETQKAKLPKGATPLTELTSAPKQLTARLAQCGLVDVEDGPALAKQLSPGQRLVSKEGHLWRWDGFVRTPKAPVSAAVQLEQQARLEAANSELEPLKTELEQAKTALAEIIAENTATQAAQKDARQTASEAFNALDAARSATAEARQAREHAAMKSETTRTALVRVETDLRHVTDALALAARPQDHDTLGDLEADLLSARKHLEKLRETEILARGHLTDLTRGREQTASRRESLKRDLSEWGRRAEAATTRLNVLNTRKQDTLAKLEENRPTNAHDQAESSIDEKTQLVEALEAERTQAAERLNEAEAHSRQAEDAARTANATAAKSREALAGASVLLETASTRVAETIEIARNQFQRLPEGLMPLAAATLGEEAIAGMTFADASQKADYLKRDRDQLGGVNMDAEAEAAEMSERLGVQATEKKDLVKAISKLREGVDALNIAGRDRLLAAFETVNEHFKALFTALFRGGQAELRLVGAEDPLAAGLEIFAQPPGKRLGTLRLMSGGEQALTAAALIFAVFLSNPAPICVLDEVDAPLDDANVDRFCRMLNEMRNRTNTRFIVITHNPVTMSRMDRLFGVTMREKGVSKLVSVDLNTAEELVAAE